MKAAAAAAVKADRGRFVRRGEESIQAVWDAFDKAAEEKKARVLLTSPLLIGRLVWVGKIVHYGNEKRTGQHFPFKFTFRLGTLVLPSSWECSCVAVHALV